MIVQQNKLENENNFNLSRMNNSGTYFCLILSFVKTQKYQLIYITYNNRNQKQISQKFSTYTQPLSLSSQKIIIQLLQQTQKVKKLFTQKKQITKPNKLLNQYLLLKFYQKFSFLQQQKTQSLFIAKFFTQTFHKKKLTQLHSFQTFLIPQKTFYFILEYQLSITKIQSFLQDNQMKSVPQQSLFSNSNQLVPNSNFNHLNSQYINGSNNSKPTHNSNEDDIMNFQTLITKLSKGSIPDKAIALKKLLFLYENSRARIYLYQRRIVESLQLCLLIEQKQISLSGLNLLEKILTNASTQSQIAMIFRKKLLSKVVLNLGSADINVRKISHKCIQEFIRKFKDYESVIHSYLKTALRPSQQQSTTKHLKLKAINSFHSLLMTDSKSLRMDQEYALQIIQQLIASSYQKQFSQIRRASLICLICILKINGSENTLKLISIKTQNQLYQLKMESDQLASLLQIIMKFHSLKNEQQNNHQSDEDDQFSSQDAPSPKFISIQESEVLIQKPPKQTDQFEEKLSTIIANSEHQSLSEIQPQPHQLKIFNQVSYAEEFLKKLEKISFSQSASQSLEEIKSFAPFLEKYLVDQSIKLFSISKKIVEVIFDSMQQGSINDLKVNKRKQVYIIIVPCVVKGIGNKRFIVRKNLDKLVRTYAKNHPDVWLNNFLDRFVKTQNIKIKEMLIDLFSYAYKTSPEFFYPIDKPFEIFDSEISNKNSTLRWKAIDCVILMIERQGKQTVIQQMLQKFSIDSYNKILRKLNKNVLNTAPTEQRIPQDHNTGLIDIQIPSPVSGYKRKFRKNPRISTDQGQKMLSNEKQENNTDRNVSQERKINLNKGLFFKDKQNRKSFIDYDLKQKRKTQKKSLQSRERTSIQRLPELKQKNVINSHSLSKNQTIQGTMPQSPVKKSFTEKNIMYTQKSQLQYFDDPKMQLQKALTTIKNSSSSWMAHFDSINKVRAIIQNHPNVISEDHLQSIVTDLINCLNGNSRSGVMKISLICLDELLLKLKKRLYPYTQTIIHAILKKSISTSEFIADELKKCICICTQELCVSKLISYVNSVLKESRNTQIKLNILLIIQTMIKNQKIYKKEAEWIWMTLIQIHDEPQFQLRLQCKNVVKLILQLYKGTWKLDVSGFRKNSLEKIDKILKNLNQKGDNSWLQQQGIEFQKILYSKGISAKYFASQYTKFQQTDRTLLIKKNWKDRIKNINDFFNLAFEYSSQFQINLNARKYMNVLCDHFDEKNPGQLLNAVALFSKSIDYFVNTQLIEEVLGVVLEKYIFVIDTKRLELISTYQKLINKIYQKLDIAKIVKQLVRLALNNSLKVKNEALNQLIIILKEDQPLKRQERESIGYGQKNRSKQKLKNKQNTMKDLVMQTPNVLSVNSKLSYNIGSQTPSATSSSINIQQNCLSINSENKIINNNIDNSKPKFTATVINSIMKMLNKLAIDKTYENSNIINSKIKDLMILCNKKFGNQSSGKGSSLHGSHRNAEFVE